MATSTIQSYLQCLMSTIPDIIEDSSVTSTTDFTCNQTIAFTNVRCEVGIKGRVRVVGDVVAHTGQKMTTARDALLCELPGMSGCMGGS